MDPARKIGSSGTLGHLGVERAGGTGEHQVHGRSTVTTHRGDGVEQHGVVLVEIGDGRVQDEPAVPETVTAAHLGPGAGCRRRHQRDRPGHDGDPIGVGPQPVDQPTQHESGRHGDEIGTLDRTRHHRTEIPALHGREVVGQIEGLGVVHGERHAPSRRQRDHTTGVVHHVDAGPGDEAREVDGLGSDAAHLAASGGADGVELEAFDERRVGVGERRQPEDDDLDACGHGEVADGAERPRRRFLAPTDHTGHQPGQVHADPAGHPPTS